jgi:predicted aminopeptidase
MYLWQDSYLCVLTEIDDSKLRARILEARAALEQRYLSPINDEELRAMSVAAVALDALERKRPDIARRISDIHSGTNPHARDLDI